MNVQWLFPLVHGEPSRDRDSLQLAGAIEAENSTSPYGWTQLPEPSRLTFAWAKEGSSMRFLVMLAAFSTVAAASPAQSAPRVSLSPSVQKDVQCFVLFAAAADSAGKGKDDAARAASGLGVMYFLGKLQVGAPGLDLVAAVRQEADTFDDNPKLKDIGASCDTEFQKRGSELVEFGKQLQEPTAK